jgi:hypothetical protein
VKKSAAVEDVEEEERSRNQAGFIFSDENCEESIW